jgi:hypothetical protein
MEQDFDNVIKQLDIKRGEMIVALERAIRATFNFGRWRELGYLTGTIDIINNHPRLLRSLEWGDSDYSGNILGVLPKILGENDENLTFLIEFVGLEDWLREHDHALYAKIYGGQTTAALERVQEIGKIHNVKELQQHTRRILRGIQEDPAQAIGSPKELLETAFKTVLGEHTVKIGDDIQELSKKGWKKLGLAPDMVGEDVAGAAAIRRTLNNLVQIVVGVAELRGLYGTGHGRSKAPDPDPAFAHLIVVSAVAVATFVLETWEAQSPS